MTVSIIIPFYNTPLEYFKELCEQMSQLDKEHFEVIFVNDGSTNEELMQYVYSELVNRYVVVNCEHKGVSAARNVGIKTATKDYLTFIDSDDLVNCYILKKIVLDSFSYDLIFLKSETFFHKENILFSETQYEIWKTEESIENLYTIDRNLPSSFFGFGFRACYSILFKRKLLISNDYLFNINLSLCEDCMFVGDVYKKRPSFCLIKGPSFYFYRMNIISASRRLSYDFFPKYTTFYDLFIEQNKTYENRIYFVNYDTIAIYLNVRICMAVKHLMFIYAYKVAKMAPVRCASVYFKDKKHRIQKYRKRICFYVRNRLYILVIISIVMHRLLNLLFHR